MTSFRRSGASRIERTATEAVGPRAIGVPTIAVFATTFPPAYLGGGPARTLAALLDSVKGEKPLTVLAPDRDADGTLLDVESNRWTLYGDVPAFYVSADRPFKFAQSLRQIARSKPDIIYLNSFFNLKFSILPQLLARPRVRSRMTILLAPRGELDAGALAQRARKKRIFLTTYRLLGLQRNVVWHASSKDESDAIHRIFRHANVLIRENETLLPALPLPPSTPTDHTRIVFVGRISPKKGLHILLEAMTQMRRGITLDVYGPEEDSGYAKVCRRLLRVAPDYVHVNFRGPLPPGEVSRTFADYDAFACPTRGENFGHVIAEALAGSCPVLIHDTTPWTARIRQGGAGAIVPMDVGAWVECLEALTLQDSEHRLASKILAGEVYTRWRSEDKGPNVFDLLMES